MRLSAIHICFVEIAGLAAFDSSWLLYIRSLEACLVPKTRYVAQINAFAYMASRVKLGTLVGFMKVSNNILSILICL